MGHQLDMHVCLPAACLIVKHLATAQQLSIIILDIFFVDAHKPAATHFGLPCFPPCRLILATGGTDSRLHLHLRPPGGSFQPAAKLSGHENWVRSLAFCHVSREVSGSDQSQAPELILASASQDRWVDGCMREGGCN
jgi:hypothetical protein